MSDYLSLAAAMAGDEVKPSGALQNVKEQNKAAEKVSLIDAIKKKKGTPASSKRPVSPKKDSSSSSSASDSSENTEELMKRAKTTASASRGRKLKREFTGHQRPSFYGEKSVSPKELNVGAKDFKLHKHKQKKLEEFYDAKNASDSDAGKKKKKSKKKTSKASKKKKMREVATSSRSAPAFEKVSSESGDAADSSSSESSDDRALMKLLSSRSGFKKLQKLAENTAMRKSLSENSDCRIISVSEDVPRRTGSSMKMKSAASMKKKNGSSDEEAEESEKGEVKMKKGRARVEGYDQDQFQKALVTFHAHLNKQKSRLPTKKQHVLLKEGEVQELQAVLKKVNIPLAKLKWNKQTLAQYKQEYARYFEFCSKMNICAKPSSVSEWSVSNYAELLARTSGFEQSRAIYFSHFKCFVSAVKPFSTEMNAVYSSAFKVLNNMIKPRSQATGVGLSHLLRMCMVSETDMMKVVLTREADQKVGNTNKKRKVIHKITYHQAMGYFVRVWFGMLRLDDATSTSIVASPAGKRVKFTVRDSKTDKHAHGASFTLKCCCGETMWGPWRDQVKICPVHSISDVDYHKTSLILKDASAVRQMCAEPCSIQSGEKIEVVSRIARHRQLQSTQDYAVTAFMEPDEVRIPWPVCKGRLLKDVCQEADK
eukprot:g11366.t1